MNPITMIFGLIAIAVMAPLAVHFLNSQSRQTMATVAALQMARIEKAAQGYITTYAATIEANATATNPATITVPMLVSTGYLPNGFKSHNPYGQKWEVQVLQPSAGQLQALVLSFGKNPAPTRDLIEAAQIAGASGGVIGGGTGDMAVPGCNGGEACGVYAGWKVPTSGYSAQPGHLAALIEYSNGQVQNDYLYRTAVPGQPQLNTMQTNLDMGNNNINNANEVNAQSETLAGGDPNGQFGALQIGSNYFYGDSQNAAVRTPGGFYIQNQNASGPASIDEVDNINASGQVVANYDARLGTANGTASQNAGCSEYGEIAASANGNGQLLMCNGNSWQPTGGGSTYEGYWQIIPGETEYEYIGYYNICAITQYGTNGPYEAGVEPVAGPYANGIYLWEFYSVSAQNIVVSCWDIG